MKTVKVYSTTSCPWCFKAKDYLRNKGVYFEEIDISKDVIKAKEMFEASGQMGVPVIMIDKKVVVGFNQKKLDELLEI